MLNTISLFGFWNTSLKEQQWLTQSLMFKNAPRCRIKHKLVWFGLHLHLPSWCGGVVPFPANSVALSYKSLDVKWGKYSVPVIFPKGLPLKRKKIFLVLTLEMQILPIPPFMRFWIAFVSCFQYGSMEWWCQSTSSILFNPLLDIVTQLQVTLSILCHLYVLLWLLLHFF